MGLTIGAQTALLMHSLSGNPCLLQDDTAEDEEMGGRVEGWKIGRVEGWKSGRVEEWKGGRVEGWKDGRVEEWKGGRVEGWKIGVRSQVITGNGIHDNYGRAEKVPGGKVKEKRA